MIAYLSAQYLVGGDGDDRFFIRFFIAGSSDF
jgi:hypothetical protein